MLGAYNGNILESYVNGYNHEFPMFKNRKSYEKSVLPTVRYRNIETVRFRKIYGLC